MFQASCFWIVGQHPLRSFFFWRTVGALCCNRRCVLSWFLALQEFMSFLSCLCAGGEYGTHSLFGPPRALETLQEVKGLSRARVGFSSRGESPERGATPDGCCLPLQNWELSPEETEALHRRRHLELERYHKLLEKCGPKTRSVLQSSIPDRLAFPEVVSPPTPTFFGCSVPTMGV